MQRRRFLALIGVAVPGLWLDGTRLIQLPRDMVISFSGRCSFCGKHAKEVFGLAGIATRPVRICNECLDICLEILRDDYLHLQTSQPAPDNRAHAHDLPLPQTQVELDAFIESIRKQIDQTQAEQYRSRHDSLACSFCDKKQEEAKRMIAGPTVYICDSCIGDAASLLGLHS